MISEKLTEEELTEKQEKVKSWLHVLDKIYGVKMTVFLRRLVSTIKIYIIFEKENVD